MNIWTFFQNLMHANKEALQKRYIHLYSNYTIEFL